jgi:hypothetical protein
MEENCDFRESFKNRSQILRALNKKEGGALAEWQWLKWLSKGKALNSSPSTAKRKEKKRIKTGTAHT